MVNFRYEGERMRTGKFSLDLKGLGKELEGQIFPTKANGKYKVIQYISATKVVVEFISTGYTRECSKSSMVAGSIKDPYYPRYFGTAFFGEGPYIQRDPAYNSWYNMIGRCYDKGHRVYGAYGGAGVTVCTEWHNYQVFAEWYHQNKEEGGTLDKDVLSFPEPGKYSPDTCAFIPEKLNRELIGFQSNGFRVQKSGRFQALINIDGVKEGLGTFDTKEEAKNAYCTAKELRIKSLAEEYYSQGVLTDKVYKALQGMRLNRGVL